MWHMHKVALVTLPCDVLADPAVALGCLETFGLGR
jgi:hypothetical protein